MAALPYIQLYVADYLADTAHLTAAQHGAYLLLIFNYWQRSRSLNNSNERLANVARMSNAEWLEAKPVLAEFFTVEGDEWIHHRIETDLVAVHLKSTKASNAGKASVQSKLIKRSTNVQQTFNHTDTDTDTDTDNNNNNASASLPCPAQQIVDLYHACLPDNPKVRVLSEKRKGVIRSRWKEAAKLDILPFGYSTQPDGLKAWEGFFKICAESDFLTGRVPPTPGRSVFIADLDFLLSSEKFIKTLENKYHREAPQ